MPTNFCKWNLVVWLQELDLAQNALQQERGNFPFANWNVICWGLTLQLVQLIKIHFLPHLDSFMWEQKFEKKFFKKNPIQPPNGVLSICKLPFPNGSYRNGVCRGLWAISVWSQQLKIVPELNRYLCNLKQPLIHFIKWQNRMFLISTVQHLSSWITQL